ncbi:MAG: glycosyltransferase family 1 protein [Patescibacteria group bacterium]|nr:glycosyltransferase family 1 protein [Patescibacteria group bacterium]
MKIAIDARMMGAGNTRGIGRYIEELVRAMLDLGTDDEFVLLVRQSDHPFARHPRVSTVLAPVSWYGFAEQLKMPGILERTGADVVHVPHWNVPLLYRGPLVVTVHDLLLRHYPSSAKTSTRSWPIRLMKRILYRAVVGHAVRAAKKILIPTEFTRHDVESFYPGAKGKSVMTGEGMPKPVSGSSYPVSSTGRATSYQIPDTSYLLYVGSAYPHKGLDDLLSVWPEIRRRHAMLRLIIAGEMDIFMQRMKASHAAQGGVDYLGKVSDDSLERLYGNAIALVFPSHFEGFGLPPLEALAHGCPVISSDAASLPEVLGKHGIEFFHVGDGNGILLAVEKVLSDRKKAREAAASAAHELQQRHDWRKAAKLTLEAYHSVKNRV